MTEMDAETIVGLSVAAVPVLLAAGAGINWAYQAWWRSRAAKKDQSHAAFERDEHAFNRMHKMNQHLSDELDEFTPALTKLRHDYTDAVKEIVELLDKLRLVSEVNVRLTNEHALERRALLEAINNQAEHIEFLREQIRRLGVVPPPRPQVGDIVKNLQSRQEEVTGTVEEIINIDPDTP